MTLPTLPPWPSSKPNKLGRKKKTSSDKVIDALENNTGALVTPDIIESVSPELQEVILNEDNVTFKPSPGPQTDFLASPEREVLYGGAKGGGKALKLDTIIATPHGFKTLEEIKTGDHVISGEGNITTVLVAHPPIYDDSYEIKFSTGETIVANKEHLWTVLDADQRCVTSRGKPLSLEKVVTTQTILDNLYVRNGKARTVNYSVELHQPIQLPEVTLPLDPYVFGLWLGDGNSTSAVIGMESQDMDNIIPHVPSVEWVKEKKLPNIKPMKTIKFSSITKLKELNVYQNKHIPSLYLRASLSQRLALLQGLMDTDGHARKNKGQCEITLKSKRLLSGVAELVRSLGVKTTIISKIAKCQNGYTCEVYRITFYSGFPVFRLERKLKNQKLLGFRPTVNRRFITGVTPVGKCLMRCLTVDSPSRTFLVTTSFIKTHNSYALLVDPLRYMNSKHSRAMIIRRSTPDLRDMVAKAHQIYPKAYPGVKWNAQQNMFVFPSGARIEFTFCETQSDLSRFQGQNMTYCGLDEAASHPYLPELLTYIRSNIRSVDIVNAPPLLRMTANPGEVCSNYLRKEFVERAAPNETFWDHIKIFDPRTKEHRVVTISKKYIPATVFDNPYLTSDDSYLATLAALPETKRKQWLEGNWFVSEMSAFPEFDINTHVTAPMQIGRDWKRVKGQDWGFSSDGAVYWGAVKPDGQLVIYREYVFRKKDAMQVAQEGRSMELGEPRSVGVIDASVFQQRGTLGQTIGEIMQQNWPSWVPSSRARINNNSSRAHRKNLVHTHLATNPLTGQPRMVILPTCRKLIEALSGLPVDKNDPEKVDTDSPLDHYFDALSYLLQGRPAQLRSWTDPFSRKAEKPYQVLNSTFGY